MNTNTPKTLLALSLITLSHACAATPAFAEPTRDGAHLDTSVGLGMNSVGLGVVAGYRNDFGLRLEGAFGTYLFGTGGSVGAGYSFRVHDGAFTTLEVPVLAYALAGWLYHDEPLCTGSDPECDSKPLTKVGALESGLDVLLGGGDTRFLVSLRGGLATTGKAIGPIGQVSIGVAF